MELYDYQEEGVKWLLKKERCEHELPEEINSLSNVRGGILADEVGLGKTMMMISVMKENMKKNTLVLVPKSLIVQWKKEFEKVKTDNIEIIEIIDSKTCVKMNEDETKSQVVITSHSKLNGRSIDPESLWYCSVQWDRIIIDEAHVIKNKRSKLHKVCLLLKSKIRWALTATPVMNKMEDFVYTLNWVGVSQDMSQNYKELVSEHFIKRRTKEDVSHENKHLELPKLTIENVKIPFETSEEYNLYLNIHANIQKQMKEMIKTDDKNVIKALELLLRIRQVCCHPQVYVDGLVKKQKKLKQKSDVLKWEFGCSKLKAIVKEVGQTEKDDQCLLFCHFVKEMDEYCIAFEKMGISWARIDGSMDIAMRAAQVAKFNGGIKVFVIQINVGGCGYNFQKANHVFITSPTWNPAMQHQVIGRSHRTGQTKPVYAKIYSITSEKENEHYIEDYVLRLQDKKLKMMAEILNDPRISKDTKENEKEITFSDVAKMFSS